MFWLESFQERPTSCRSCCSAPPRQQVATPTAIVYCEANFGQIDGKTANGLVRYSERYRIVAVIDSATSGLDAGAVLDGTPNGIPIYRDLGDALDSLQAEPDTFIYGMAPATGKLSAHERTVVLTAIQFGMNVVNGLHEFLNDDPVFLAASKAANVRIVDIRKPRPQNDLRLFTGRVNAVPCPRIAVLGTDLRNWQANHCEHSNSRTKPNAVSKPSWSVLAKRG